MTRDFNLGAAFGLFLVSALVLPADAAVRIMSVNAARANIREGPGTRYRAAWRAWENEPLQVLRHIGPWAEIRDFEGNGGWVLRGILSDRPTAVVKAEAANVRSGPGTRFETVWEVERGYVFEVLDAKGRWINVLDGGGDEVLEGWIHRSLLWGNARPARRKSTEEFLDKMLERT